VSDAASPPRKLLVLDLDETLVHAAEVPLAHSEDFRVGPYFVYRRPHLDHFLEEVCVDFDVGIWTASGEKYASGVIERIFPPGTLRFIWSSQRCTTARDWTTGHYVTIKNLSKLKKQGYAMDSIIAVDDTPGKYARSYGNLVVVREYLGAKEDDELLLLAKYLRSLASVPNVRAIEKRHWRSQVVAVAENGT
jgi:RNA polymerase II subunit A small phosphatase-like protein